MRSQGDSPQRWPPDDSALGESVNVGPRRSSRDAPWWKKPWVQFQGLGNSGAAGYDGGIFGETKPWYTVYTYIHTCMHACMHAYIHIYIYTYSNSICCFIKCFISFCYIFIYVYIGGFLFLPQGKIGDVCCELGTLQHVGESNELPDVPCSRSNQAPRHGPRQTSFWAVAGSDRTGATWLHGTLCQDGKLTTRWNIGPPFCWS